MIPRRTLALLGVILLPAVSRGLTLYRLELVGGGVVFAENEPEPSGTTFVFRSSPQGIFVALRRSDVVKVERIEADNKPPLDLGKATLKQAAAPRPATLRRDPLEVIGVFGAHDGPPPDGTLSPGGRRYPQRGDDMPGNRVAYPVSRDDLMYGNYRPFPAANGGQTGPAPMIKEGQGTPKGGSLAEPPKAIQLADPPAKANAQVPVVPLVYSEKPHVDDAAPAPRPTPKSAT